MRSPARTGARVLALWCADWPAVAAAATEDLPPTEPVAVLAGGRIVACTAPARAAGVTPGLRRRDAQGRCPRLHVLTADENRDARVFEPVAAAADAAAPGVEVLRPGLLVLSARGVVRYLGSEEVAAERLVDEVAAVGIECQIGIADELSTAVIAARHCTLVPPGAGARFLASLPIAELAVEPALAPADRVDLVDLLRRLGLRTIGDFAALSPASVVSRFGADAALAHRSARAEPERPPSGRPLPPDLTVELRLDPPADRVDAAAFAGRTLAERLHSRLSAASVACTRVAVQASTAHGERFSRIWRCAEPLTPEDTADRIRWQLDGWLTGRSEARPTAGIELLRLEPIEVVASGALQLGLWGGTGVADERARRALVRVQGLLGGESVRFGVLSGGRGPGERVTVVPLGDEPVPAADPAAPWPGRLPEPAPTAVHPDPPAVTLEDAVGAPVTVTDRGEFSGRPQRLGWGDRGWDLLGCAGPWPVDEQWWDPASARRVARVQLLLAPAVEGEQARALLVRFDGDLWRVEGTYE